MGPVIVWLSCSRWHRQLHWRQALMGATFQAPCHLHLTPSRLNWCGSASTALRAPLTAAATLLTRIRVLRAHPEFYWLGKAFLKIFSPCVTPHVDFENVNCSCSVLHTRIWTQEHSCLCAWTAKLLPKEQRKWIWWRYSAGQQYLRREGFDLDINQYIIAYVACLSSLLMI